LLPTLTLLAAAFALGGIALTVLLPSQILKPDALRAQALVEQSYREMLDEALRGFPKETTADLSKEACWTKGKTVCIYGWYAEWKGAVYLMSFTYAAEAEDRQGRLRGWWWEVDVEKETVRPVWRAPELIKRYRLQETDEFRRVVQGKAPLPDRPLLPPLLKIP
ncbi:MAG TPA: hypothetical protein VFA47_02745, partial [Candidatus Manganitrophaceae bacterium]|nr:hypothetical protein [Candidatus Manganitrophaceae bacterium]